MPCWTRTLITMDLKVADPELLADALRAEGFYFGHAQVDEIIATGKITLDERRADLVQEIKRNYAIGAIKKVAKARRWNVKQNDNKLTIRR